MLLRGPADSGAPACDKDCVGGHFHSRNPFETCTGSVSVKVLLAVREHSLRIEKTIRLEDEVLMILVPGSVVRIRIENQLGIG